MTEGQAFHRVWDSVREPRSILVGHEMKFQSRGLEALAYRRVMSATSFGPVNLFKTPSLRALTGRLCNEGLPVHHCTSLAEGQTKNEAWRLDENQHLPHGVLGHPTPIVIVAQPQGAPGRQKKSLVRA